jgi:hypothetical protein
LPLRSIVSVTTECVLVSLTTGRILERKLGENNLVVPEAGVGVVDVRLKLSEVLAVPVLQRIGKYIW